MSAIAYQTQRDRAEQERLLWLYQRAEAENAYYQSRISALRQLSCSPFLTREQTLAIHAEITSVRARQLESVQNYRAQSDGLYPSGPLINQFDGLAVTGIGTSGQGGNGVIYEASTAPEIKKKRRKRMSYDDDNRSSKAVAIYDPNKFKGMANHTKEEMLSSLQDTKNFLKIAKGWDDKKVGSLKMSELGEEQKKAAAEITLGKFEEWAGGTIKKEPWIVKIPQMIASHFSSPQNLSVDLVLFCGVVIVLIIAGGLLALFR